MGAALTYARRYALFTLVGIAGEDDLDAPDLNLRVEAKRDEPEGAEAKTDAEALPLSRCLSNGQVQRRHGGARNGARVRSTRPMLNVDESAAQRDQLIADLAQLRSLDEAADWVHKNMPAKNALTAADADLVGVAFRDRLVVIDLEISALENRPHLAGANGGTELNEQLLESEGAPSLGFLEGPGVGSMVPRDPPEGCERGVAGKTIRLQRALQICGDAGLHYLWPDAERSAPHSLCPRALGRKVSDEYTVPVCRLHHRELHRYGDEASWWAITSIDPLPIALELWKRSRSGHG